MSRSLAQIYADALMSDTEKVFCRQLEWVTSIMHRHSELLDILSMPEISLEEKKKNLEDIFEETIDPQLFNLLVLLASNGRLHLLDSIYQELLKKVNEEDHILSGKIVSVFQLEEKKIQEIEERFGKYFNAKVRLSLEIKHDIIGGIMVIIGDRVFDGSISSQLSKLKEYILND